MPRNYKRKTTNSFQGYKIDFAVKAIDAGSSIRLAAKNYGVTFSTLRRFYQRKDVANYASLKVGRRSLFTEYQQRSLFKALSFHESTRKQLRRKVFIFARSMKVDLPSSWKRNRLSGIEWTLAFLKKYPNLGMFVFQAKKFRATTFTCVSCVEVRKREEVKFVCENCCLCTCAFCFSIKKFRCCVDEL